MPVFRVEKNSNYTTMCNYHLRDQGLSLKGKGLLSMLLSLPDTWNYSVRGLSSITPDGVDGVLTALKELERLGYLENGGDPRHSYVLVVDKVNPGLTDLFLKQARKVLQAPEKGSVLEKLKQEPPERRPAAPKKREPER
ncbi:helix-turn-helix domain-containing protein [Hominisplanchenecus murintestinalis]|uniref:Helix-turn-helix domain-containing protein n=1 Tax=Hominisplanchenecus murintestinalis TaxID=2941517 RepID=A0AC61QV44_9FIRM|nr:helix-turn-helix domain-containing protein [Hominisplanchenecus murintestinalis]